MTKEETIKWLESLKAEIGKSEHRSLWHYAASIDMAIETLSEPNGDLISRADAMGAVQDHFNADGFKGYDDGQKMMDRIKALPSADAEPMTEEVREALMRLSMCAREDCVICKYTDKCNFDFQYEESTKNMNTILDSLMRSKCEVDAKWIPCSERLPEEEEIVLTSDSIGHIDFGQYDRGQWYWLAEACADYWMRNDGVIAWMPIPKPYERKGIEHAPDCPFCVRYETDECLKNECKHLQSYKESEVDE